MAYLLAIIFLVIAANFFVWLRQSKNLRKPVKRSMSEAKAAELRHLEIQRRFELEQKDAVERIELRNKTLALYEQVRKQAEAEETGTENHQ